MRALPRSAWVATALLPGCAALALAAGAGADGFDAAAARNGKVAYGRYCVSCHGRSGRGDGPLARDLAVPVPDLTTMAARNNGLFPLNRVKLIILNGETLRGHGDQDMPAWGDAFKKTEGIAAPTVKAAVSNLGHYIWSLQREAGR